MPGLSVFPRVARKTLSRRPPPTWSRPASGGAGSACSSPKELRAAFLDHYARHDHLVVPSASLLPQSDPSLPFTNAGMNQFKTVLAANATPKAKRIANVQKCAR